MKISVNDRIVEWKSSASSEYDGKWIILDASGTFLTATDSLAEVSLPTENIIFFNANIPPVQTREGPVSVPTMWYNDPDSL